MVSFFYQVLVMQGNRNALYDFLLKNIVWGMLDKQVHSGSKEKTKISAFNWNAPETGNWYQIPLFADCCPWNNS